MLIDDVTITVTAGHGGKGAVAFNKNMMSLGPVGGDGGKGGNIFFVGVSDLGALRQFRYKKDLKAENGENGAAQCRDGATGKDMTLKVPVGTVIHNLAGAEKQEIVSVGQEILIAKGGKGGRGNFSFRSSRNTTPTQFQEGKPGETFALRLELKLIADVGLIGLPNAGKTSLLNALTRASAKVANYPFTTLEPNLGVYYGLILADIPGLIEGASAGKGLGIKFLRHIERTKILFHLVAADSADPVLDYKTIRRELEQYSPMLLEKQEYVFLSKADMISKKEADEKVGLLQKENPSAAAFSIYDHESMEQVKAVLNRLML
ncbi:MAG: GTPase ObgE [Candidatus Wildermuthbacteria bacterium]|nr:GTPase ObgE [Candidatus Wildermuthbacteria bacterium]